MKTQMTIAAALAIAGVMGSAGNGHAQDNSAALAVVKARQATMDLYAFNIGFLGAMAKGDVEYDAEAAKGAASNLAKLSSMDQSRIWVPGTDNGTLGDATRALPAIWEDGSTAREKAGALREAAANLESQAGEGLDALRGAMGPVGAACGACHKEYRQPDS